MAVIPDGGDISIIRQNVNVVVEEVTSPLGLDDYAALQVNALKELKGISVFDYGETRIDGSRALRFSYTYTVHDLRYRAKVHTLQRGRVYYVITGISQINNYRLLEDELDRAAVSFRFE